MSKSIINIAWFAAAMILGAAAADAQVTRKPVRIGVMSSSNPEIRSAYWDNFKDGMAKLGWIEGRDVVYLYRYARGSGRFDALAGELMADKPDLVFSGTQGGAVALRRASRTIPIVFAYANDPVAGGLVASLARPGGNATGLSSQANDLSAKHLELLREIQPRLRRVSVVTASTVVGQEQRKIVELVARKMEVELHVLQFSVDEMDRVLDAVAKVRPDGVLFYGGALNRRHKIVERMAKLRVPAIYTISEMVVAGGLLSYGADLGDNYRRAAGYADKILKGAKPADLPVEQPRVFEMAVNLKAAREQESRSRSPYCCAPRG